MRQKAALASEHKGDRKEAERNCNHLRTKCAEKAQGADRNRTGLSRTTRRLIVVGRVRVADGRVASSLMA